MTYRLTRHAVLPLIAVLQLFTPQAQATGWNDYEFDLPYGYLVLRANASDIHIWGNGENNTVEELPGQLKLGNIFELAVVNQFILVKNWQDEFSEWDESKARWTIIDGGQRVTHGPFTEAEFRQKAEELKIPEPIPWKTTHEAHKEAIRDGRSDPDQPFHALIGKILFLGISLIFLVPRFMVYGLPAAFLIRFLKHWTLLKSFLWAWFGMSAVYFIRMSAMFIYMWYETRFL